MNQGISLNEVRRQSETLAKAGSLEYAWAQGFGGFLNMRFLIFALGVFSIGSIVAAAYTPTTVENYMAYADFRSRGYSAGDNGSSQGWRECAETVNTPQEIGVVCEGVRSILIHGGKMVDVNYYCEFRFSRVGDTRFHVEAENCQ
jgi:hypothetical protein